VHVTSYEVRDADHYVGRRDRHQDEDRHQGRLRQDRHQGHLHQDHQVERHQGHQDEGQNQDVNQGHRGHQYEDHQDRYVAHQDHQCVGHQDQDVNQGQDAIQDQDGNRLGHQDADHQVQHDHQEAEVLVDQRQTLVRVVVESDEDLHLGHAVACRLEAFPLEDDLQESMAEKEVVERLEGEESPLLVDH
jgi:hypothetical protein